MVMDVCHAMTDGTGAYEVLRTLLYYYCSEKYGVTLKEDGIRLAGDIIPEEEWVDPVEKTTDLPVAPQVEIKEVLIMNENMTELVFILDRSGSMSGLEDDTIGGFNGMLKKQKEESEDVNSCS